MYIFDYLGAFYLWVFKSLFRKKISYRDVLAGKGEYTKGDRVDESAYAIKLKVIGVVVTMIIIHMLARI